ncbi:MAG: aminomethyl-transferring glycine dehydrogenase [Pseudomonadota bacterium]|nr:aminomethyl-transferring glycine dehydrogenase [Pseudomonadota bacterium]
MQRTESLEELEAHDAFERRHIGCTPRESEEMLEEIGFTSIAELVNAVVPSGIRRKTPLALPAPLSESEALARLREIASRNAVFRSYIGQGYYGTITPPVIARNVLENPAWYTAYTPYQPEISQGRLEALVNFQTMITDLTGMAIANASMLDEATAAAEAMMLCLRMSKSKGRRMFIAEDVFAQTQAVVRTRAAPLHIEVVTGPCEGAARCGAFAVLLQFPASDGTVRDLRKLVDEVHADGGFAIVAADLLALTVLSPPGEWGADIVVGTSQRFGVPMGYGGPHAGYLATRDEFKRSMPGRLVGVTVDAQGRPAYRLALQTREQHIRREKATSNICTAQVLLAVIASMYAVYHGAEGVTRIARRVHRLTVILAAGLRRLALTVPTQAFFDTITVDAGDATAQIIERAMAARLNLRRIDDTTLGVSLDETTTRADVERLWRVFCGRDVSFGVDDIDEAAEDALPPALVRQSSFLTHPTFRRYRSETEMLRYLRRLADRDIALDRSMIPLGSCTMKLNATAEMIPISWPEFAHVHPFAPDEQTQGYRALVDDLERMLCTITGYDAFSLQPNAGSQGEYAGLLAIQAYHRSRGEAHRDVCLIPSSAHGTNPASAQMVGMQVVVVACDREGNIDLGDLEAKARAHRDRLAAVMVTYPSTHGVFEAEIQRLCEIVHECGGQVYVDGANLNALVGLAAPGEFGADVSHLNLHKTFCIPHGGGGPGVGPVGVRAHLAAFLPGRAGADGVGAVSAAPFGSASILPISWMYVTMMGAQGLTRATQSAILAANYVAHRLAAHFPVLYAGAGGLVAHECILDLRPMRERTDVTVDDVAKRLMDYGFHAPTMSFPVPGTLMIEPTESESKVELDRFVDAMIAIRAEISEIEAGRSDREDNPLKHAPHTSEEIAATHWPHVYSREVAAFPVSSLRGSKYWPPVARIDNAYGDRHLFCSCVPVSEFADDATPAAVSPAQAPVT